VKQDQRLTLTALAIVQLYAIDLDKIAAWRIGTLRFAGASQDEQTGDAQRQRSEPRATMVFAACVT
jgi:hypothetical protein